MISKLARLRLLAILCGPLLGMATILVNSLATGVTLRLMPGTDAAVWQPASYVLAWIPLTALVTAFAAFFGAYDLLVTVACVVPALLFFGATYAMNVSMYLPDNGHTINNIAGGIPPFDYGDQLWFLLKTLTWAVGTAAAAIVVKRWLGARAQRPAPSESMGLWRCVAIDLAFVSLVLVITLGLDLRYQLRLGEPSVITANVAKMLDSPTSTPAEREVALFDMRGFSDKFGPGDIHEAVTMLQGEVRVQPEPVNLVVAEELLTFHDSSALPLIEDALMHSSDPARTAPPGGWESLADSLDSTHDVTALPGLERLLESPDVATRRGASRAIREMRAPETIGPLIKGLDDPDEQIQRTSYNGLVEILDHHRSQYHWKIPAYDHAKDTWENYETERAALKDWAKVWQARGNEP